MSRLIKIWDTEERRNGALSVFTGVQVDGRALRAVADGQALVVDATSGITIVPTGLEDRFLAQIVTADKVAGSAVQLQDIADGGLTNDDGLGLVINTDMFSFESVSGLQLDFFADEFQFVPGTGLTINQVPLSKLPTTLVLTDGTRPFTAPQGGVDAVDGSDLTTLSQVQSIAGGGNLTNIFNLSGREITRGEVGYVESTSGSFQLAIASDPSTAIVQFAVSDVSVEDGASGSFFIPSNIISGVDFVSGFDRGQTPLFLSTTESGKFQTASPSVSGETILPVGYMTNNSSEYIFFPSDPVDL